MLRTFKLSTKILLLGIVIIVCFAGIITWLYPRFKAHMYDAKYMQTQHLVESVWGILDFYAKQASSDTMPLESAQKWAKEAVKNIRYDQKNYFWINDTAPRMIMHPIKPGLDGKSLSDTKDPNGKRLFVEMAEVCKKNGSGFVDYNWPKPGEPIPVPKISYVKLLPEWGWIVGSGIYIDDVEKALQTTFSIIFVVVAIIAVAGLFLSYLLARSIADPINRISGILNESAAQLTSASDQVSSASQSLAEGTSEQAASIEESSSSLEEMSSMTKHNAENAIQADKLMKDAGQLVTESNESILTLTASMQEISNASQETSNIIKTIDEIAFQTNLLALNAAVEAARAGEAGTGFAVVAEEVRNLAMRAADAAKNTAELIKGTVKKVGDGSDLVNATNETFAKVTASVAKMGELVSEIAAASNEQADGIDQINTAVAQMDRVTQQNAANAEESASASEEMNAQAAQLKGMVGELMAIVGGNVKT